MTVKTHNISLDRFGNAATAFSLKESEIQAPKEGEIQIEVEASGLNFADVMGRLGLYAPVKQLPFILGYDVVGKVVAVGSGVEASLMGKKVLSLTRFGGYAHHVNVPARAAVPLDDMPASEAISYTTAFLTAYLMVEEYIGMAKNKEVLVYSAAGGVGYFLYQFLKLRGALVTCVVGKEDKRKLLKSAGVEREIYTNQEFAALDKKFDLVYNARGGASVKGDIERLKPGGKLVMFGAADQLNNKGIFGKLKTLFGFGFHSPIKLIMKSQSLCGFNLLSYSASFPERVVMAHHQAIKIIKEAGIKPLESKGFGVSEVGEAHEYLASGLSTGKVYIDWTKH